MLNKNKGGGRVATTHQASWRLASFLFTILVLLLLVQVVNSQEGDTKNDNDANINQVRYLASLAELDDLLLLSGINNPSSANESSSAVVSEAKITRQGNLDVLELPENNNNGTIPSPQLKIIPICQLDYMVGMSLGDAPTRQRQFPLPGGWSVEGVAAVALAVQHLNTGDASVVQELQGLREQCPLQFSMATHDSYFNQRLATDDVIALTASSSQSPPPAKGELKLNMCAMLGNVMSRITLSTAVITSMRGYLQMGFSTATELEDRSLYPLSTRIVPSLQKMTQVLVQYLRYELGVKHLGVLHTDTRESQSYSVALQQSVAEIAPDMELVSLDIPDLHAPSVLHNAVAKLKETQFTYFLAAVRTGHLELLWNSTVEQGIAGTGRHTWLLPAGDEYFARLMVERTSSASARAIPGVQLVRLSGFWQQPVYDRLVKQLQRLGQSPSDMAFLRQRLPTYPGINESLFDPILFHPFQPFLQNPPQAGLATWAYDSAIAVGLAACNASRVVLDQHNQSTFTLSGKDHFQAVTTISFQGSTGHVTFDPITGTRQTPRFEIMNVQMEPITNTSRSNSTHLAFDVVTTHLYVDERLQALPNVTVIFNDGTGNIPPDLPPVNSDNNYLSRGLQAVGWIMCAVIVIVCVLASAWVMVHTKHRVVLSAQPIFLHLLLVGVAITALSIIPLSIDEGTAATDHGCDQACMSFPWLLSIGFSLAFSALWAKTHRINLILRNPNLRRMKVSAHDVAKPVLLVLCANLLVLSLWTALSPLQCETSVEVVDSFDRPIETRSYCSSDNSLAFWIVLLAINMGPLVFSLWEAYKARNISTEYAETDYILKTLVVMCLVCFMGVPVLIIAHDNPSAYFFVLTAIIFVVCMSILLLILGPKVMAFYDLKLCDESQQSPTVPLRFSRRYPNPTGRSSAFSSSGSNQFGNSDNQATGNTSGEAFSDDLASGLRILSHPRSTVEQPDEAVTEGPQALREEHSKEVSEDNDKTTTRSENPPVSDLLNTICKLKAENEGLRKRLTK